MSHAGHDKTFRQHLLTHLPIALALILSGAVSLAFSRRRGGFRLAASGIIPIALASGGRSRNTCWRPLEQRHALIADIAALGQVAAVVVLGGGWQPNPDWPISARLNESSGIRLLEGVRLLRALPEARLIVSAASRMGTGRLHRVTPRRRPSWASRQSLF